MKQLRYSWGILVAVALASACTVSNSDLPGLSGPSEGSGVLVPPQGASPTADFSLSPTKPVEGQVVFANGALTKPAPGHVIVDYLWNWGDGIGSSGLNSSHAYEFEGEYTVVLTVVDNLDNVNTKSKTISIESGKPTASFIFAIVSPRVVRFDASASTATGGASIASYSWTFGDGNSFGPTTDPTAAQNTYPATPPAAKFPVTLTVTDTLGRTGVLSQSITVP
jgi:PKD repeat protein